MYSAFDTATDEAVDESPFLFGEYHDDSLSMPLSHNGAHLKTPAPNMAHMNGISNLIYGHYNESTPSSTPYGDMQDTSEASTSHMSGGEDRDGSASSGYGIGQERNDARSSLHRAHAPQNPRPNTIATVTNNQTLSIGQGILPPSGRADMSASIPAHHMKGDFIVETPMARNLSKPQKRPTSSATPESPHTPANLKTNHSSNSSPVKGKVVEPRANSSIPSSLSWEEYARQSILAAESSRLNPFALHPDEYKLLRSHITRAQVTVYLNIRNGILRLWTRNPLVHVTWDEAAGCTRDKRYFGLAKVAYFWLLRNGYINYGCVEVPNLASGNHRSKMKTASQRTVLVVGAGMSGLGCARQLEALFAQLGSHWSDRGERPPRVIVLEGRSRVGGRVYSHPLRNQASSSLPTAHRCTAEMGAQIVTGFERGNPMNTLIRGQLALPYHGLRDNTILYDHDGSVVDGKQDMLVEKLYNDVLERASIFRTKPATFRVVEGDRNLIIFGRDPTDADESTIAELEQSSSPPPANANTTASSTEEKPSSGVEKLAGRAYQLSGAFDPNVPAAQAAMGMGWQLKAGASTNQNLNLHKPAGSSQFPTLGETMDDGFKQYQDIVHLSQRDLRLLNWHHANLEYANATSVNRLSLSGWDQDIGNEWEGEHTEVIGGYQQVPRGLWQCPDKLDVRFKTAIRSVKYNMDKQIGRKAVTVDCCSGEKFEADELVLTTPLGVLKSGSITFDPPLPDWKQGVIDRMGFGLLNKVVLVYEEAFWETHRDMFGLLNDSELQRESLDMKDYSYGRGRFYLFWNCIKTSGRPTLIALMAGDSAHYAESVPDKVLIDEVTERLKKMFPSKPVPRPSEAIVTRWSRDSFARGSYSYVGAHTRAGDYDVMARSHGPIHFAGEATCGTHPATVHGAYLSGLRAAAEVLEAMAGPLEIPVPLVDRTEKKIKLEHDITQSPNISVSPLKSLKPPKKGYEYVAVPLVPKPVEPSERDVNIKQREEYEASIIGTILSELGTRPLIPQRAGVNPFLLYTKDNWYICKNECDEAKRAATGDPDAKTSKTEIRTALGAMWRNATDEVKKPYLDQTQDAKDSFAADITTFKERALKWDIEAARIRKEYIEKHPPPDGSDTLAGDRTSIELGVVKRFELRK